MGLWVTWDYGIMHETRAGLPHGTKNYTPIIITDSKGYNLESQASTTTERDFTWFCRKGARIRECREWLESSIDTLIQEEGNIWVNVWAGTCDFTIKNGRYISLRTHDDSVVDDIIAEANLITQCIKAHPGSKVTILEIPLYSIVNWNWAARISKNQIQSFYQHDKDLEEQIVSVNRKIREVNTSNISYSPKFSSDLTLIQKHRKGDRHRVTRRVQHRFELYFDREHPRQLLSKVWLRKIEQQIIKDCWETSN
ncbi:unnamed protein product [Mytilus edulis]|uniref:Uncharacterized protein n=1 Tax=Mytilus edulis TaxID=6550 RepID=A0A8S3SFS0_MYTED|nr:unnamed protein product [Mytilus edulis]